MSARPRLYIGWLVYLGMQIDPTVFTGVFSREISIFILEITMKIYQEVNLPGVKSVTDKQNHFSQVKSLFFQVKMTLCDIPGCKCRGTEFFCHEN